MNEKEMKFIELEDIVLDTEDLQGINWGNLNVIFLLDTSSSMDGTKIHQLNTAMPLILNSIHNVASECETEVRVRVIEFNTVARWIIGDEAHSVKAKDIIWADLSASGGTDTAGAIRLACTALHTKYLGTRNYHPIVILITDGKSSNPSETHAAIEELKVAMTGNDPQKKDKVWRLAIGIQDYNESELLDFAMICEMENEYGEVQTNVPMVFNNVADLEKFFQRTLHRAPLPPVGGDESGGGEYISIIAI